MHEKIDSDHPWKGTRAQQLLVDGLKDAQAGGRSQRDVAAALHYKSSVVLSHMSTGRAPIPVEKAQDMAAALGIDRDVFTLAVLEQRFPSINFKALFEISYSSDRTVGRLEAIADCSLDELPAATRAILEEVAAARNPSRRWLAPAELATMQLIRDLRPRSSIDGLSDADRRAIEEALTR